MSRTATTITEHHDRAALFVWARDFTSAEMILRAADTTDEVQAHPLFAFMADGWADADATWLPRWQREEVLAETLLDGSWREAGA